MFFSSLFVSVKTRITSKKNNEKGLNNISIFFFFISLIPLVEGISFFLVDKLLPETFSLLYIFVRLAMLFAFLFLLKTPIYTRFSFVRKNMKYLRTILSITILLGLVIALYDLRLSEIVNDTIVYKWNFAAGFLVGFPSLVFGIFVGYSLLTIGKDNFKGGLNNSLYLFSFGAVLLGIGDIIYVLSQSSTMSYVGNSIAFVGYLSFVFVVTINYFREYK